MWFSVGGSAGTVCWGEFVFQLLHQCTGDSRSHRQAAFLHGGPSRRKKALIPKVSELNVCVCVCRNITVRTRRQLSLKVRTVLGYEDIFAGPHNFSELFMRSDGFKDKVHVLVEVRVRLELQ